MSRQPLETLTGPPINAGTPFGSTGDASPAARGSPFLSTSFDDDYQKMSEDQQTEGESLAPAATSLHSSFDAALNDEQKDSIFRRGRPSRVSYEPTWEAGAVDQDGELSGRKHLRQHVPTEAAEAPPPGTVRKLPRRSSDPIEDSDTPNVPTSRTPGRHSHFPPPTPSSTSRRRSGRASVRKSPYRKPPTATPRNFRLQEATIHVGSGTPTTSATPALNKIATVSKAKLQTCQTATTINSSLDATLDSERSVDPAGSPSSTPFRFSSFPASLPRVHPRSEERGFASPLEAPPPCPTTVRKRMTFSKAKAGTITTAPTPAGDTDRSATKKVAGAPSHLSSSYSRDEERTLNSSISSFSGDHAHQQLPQSTPSFPPPVLEWRSPDLANERGGFDRKYSEDSCDLQDGQYGASRPSPLQTKLFMDENAVDEMEYSQESSPADVPVSRTRLSFDNELSPSAPKVDGQRLAFGAASNPAATAKEKLKTDTDSRKPRESFSSSASSLNVSENLSGSMSTTTALSPQRPGENSAALPSGLRHEAPLTPNEVQLHFRLDGDQCSPIPGIPEEDSNDMETANVDFEYSTTSKHPDQVNLSKAETSNSETSKLSLSQDSYSSSTSSRRRPMPDLSAFEAGASLKSGDSSRNEKSGEDSSSQPQSPKLLCPPTPVRTPAWAHSDNTGNPFARSNSLIVTKVLATCPAQVVDGHSSLENSILDDDNSAVDAMEQKRASLSFATVEEETDEPSIQDASPQVENKSDEDMFDASPSLKMPRLPFADDQQYVKQISLPKTPFLSKWPPPKLVSSKSGEFGSIISFATNFENLGKLGSGAFADVYKVRSRIDGQMYAVKRNRRQFRGKRDRDLAMTEVHTMQKLQNVCASAASTDSGDKTRSSATLYLLFFYRAWQEEGYFFCQTELCCRDTCRELLQSLKHRWEEASQDYPSLLKHLAPDELNGEMNDESEGRLVPEPTVWKICHDVCAGLSHIHAQGIVHYDIKPSNIFFVLHNRFGAMCKIGDFGIAGEVGTFEDGQEGDTIYMAPELLSSGIKHPSADVFSLGLTLYELASAVSWVLPGEGPRWHELRSGAHVPELPYSRSHDLIGLIQRMISSPQEKRPTADDLLNGVQLVKEAGTRYDDFLHDYINDVEAFDRANEERLAEAQQEADNVGQTPRHAGRELRSPMPNLPAAPSLFTPEAAVNK